MIKTLIKLTALAILPLIYLLTAERFNPLILVQETSTESLYESVYMGPLKEVEAQLLEVEEKFRQTKFNEIASHFQNELRFAKIDELIENGLKRSRLRAGELVALGDEHESIAYPISGTDSAIAISTLESDTKELVRLASGPMYLFRRAMAEIPTQELPNSTLALQERFGWIVSYLEPHELQELASKHQLFEVDDMRWIEDVPDSPRFIFPVSSGAAISAMPIFSESLELVSLFGAVTVFLTFISLGLLVWVWPLWNDHKRLNIAAREFGNGHLESRAPIRKGSFSAELGSSFNRMADNIQGLINTNQNLTNAIAHDLRTPLARLRFANTILETGQCTPEETQRYQGAINSSIDALDYLIDQSLVYSRYNRSTNINQFRECDFSSEIVEEVEQFGFQNDDIVFKSNIDSKLINSHQYLDARALRRALTNLLNNAAKHAKSYVLVSYIKKGNTLEIKVEDDGIGIDEKDYSTIFEPYSQLNNCARNKAKGVGLGLAIVKQIANWHYGEIVVEKSPLGGASFTLTWPHNIVRQ